VDQSATIRRSKPFSLIRPVVFYGTSIAQGASASRPGMSYQAILGCMLNIDFINLGFSANGIGEPEVARTAADVDAACFVLDFAQNNRTVESLQLVYALFIETLRKKRPDTPILAITPIYSSSEMWALPSASELRKMRDHIRLVVSRRIAGGDKNIHLIEGTDLLGPNEGDGLADGTHPNDLGFQRMAERLASRLRRYLAYRNTESLQIFIELH
jgi:lysophospholipase L1-like esterase